MTRNLSFSALEKRAANQIWTAAENYDFDPLFLALKKRQHIPDFYMNLVIGLACKYYGVSVLETLFKIWEKDIHKTKLDDLTWLYLEQCVYLLEHRKRPVMEELRKEYAKDFFAGEYLLSRQEWMSKNQLVYTMQVTRMKQILQQKLPVLTIRQKALYRYLTPDEPVDKEHLTEEIVHFYTTMHLYTPQAYTLQAHAFHPGNSLANILTKVLPTQIVKTDRVTVRQSSAETSQDTGFNQDTRRSGVILKKEDSDEAYIESCFGKSMFPKKEVQKIEQEICTGNHTGTHIWYTRGAVNKNRELSRQEKYLKDQAQVQYQRNKTYYQDNLTLHTAMIHRLSDYIQNSLLVHQSQSSILSGNGKLDCTSVWKAQYLNDRRVFKKMEEHTEPSFTVDILLDSSASRLQYQEVIASQGYILSQSLMKSHIPVRVSSFCSLRGYTVIHVLKTYEDTSCAHIFEYFASGWNRDGLALQAVNCLLQKEKGKHLLIVFTDASPNDSFRIRSSKEYPLGSEYGEAAGIKDTAEAVRLLRKQSVCVSAVLIGNTEENRHAHYIYGNAFVRVQHMDELARACGILIQKELSKLEG